jgi:hypothetical protein
LCSSELELVNAIETAPAFALRDFLSKLRPEPAARLSFCALAVVSGVEVVVAVVAGAFAGVVAAGSDAVEDVLEDDELPHPASASKSATVAAASAQPLRRRRVLGLDV